MEVELILLEPNEKSGITDIEGLSHLICSHSKISNKQIEDDGIKCDFNNERLEIEIKQTENILDSITFHVRLIGEQGSLESFRGLFLNIINNYFKKKYIIKDEVSMKLCQEAYPYLNEIENLFRQYIMHFMILKVGNDWWELNVTDNVINKSTHRDDKSSYKGLINQDIYHIDFKDLLDFIYNNFSAYKTKNDILKKLNECQEMKDVKELIESASSNFDRYFKGIFNDSFRKKWEELAELRNQVAHNKLLERKNVERVKELFNELKESIINAQNDINTHTYTQEEKSAFKEKVLEEKSTRYKASLNKLEETYNITFNDIQDTIEGFKDNGSTSFTTVDIVKALNNDTYIVRESINRFISFILSESENDLGIQISNERMNTLDDNNTQTTVAIWSIL